MRIARRIRCRALCARVDRDLLTRVIRVNSTALPAEEAGPEILYPSQLPGRPRDQQNQAKKVELAEARAGKQAAQDSSAREWLGQYCHTQLVLDGSGATVWERPELPEELSQINMGELLALMPGNKQHAQVLYAQLMRHKSPVLPAA